MKRLLCIIGNMNAGGAETFLMKVYRALDRSKYQMDFCINVAEKCFYEDEITSLGGKIFRIPAKSENMEEFKNKLKAVVANNGYEYVLRITSNTMGFLDLKVAKQAGAAVCVARSSNSGDGGSFKTRIAHLFGKVLYSRYVDVKVAPSDLAAQYTFGKKAYRRGDVNIIHNAVDVDMFRYSKEKGADVRKELGIDENATVVGHVGRFMTQKNHGFLLDVFKEVLNRDKTARLLLVGKGELENSVREKVRTLGIEKEVVFAGVRSDIPDVLSAMDVFVFPSLYEGMPNTVIEAQATGLPCVISDTITREADITGIVKYLPLSSPEKWADAALSFNVERASKKDVFIEKRYDMDSVVHDFVRIVFRG